MAWRAVRGEELGLSGHLSRNLKADIGSTISMDGVQLLVARSGTACRAPTDGGGTMVISVKHWEL